MMKKQHALSIILLLLCATTLHAQLMFSPSHYGIPTSAIVTFTSHDFNTDGFEDFAIVKSNGAVNIILQQSSGAYISNNIFIAASGMPPDYCKLYTAEFNGDDIQ